MCYRFVMLIWAALLGTGAVAQEIGGYVRDAKSREPIPFASVVIRGTQKGTVTDDNGHFILSVAAGDTVDVSSVGYELWEISPPQKANTNLEILLEEDVRQLREVTVKPEVPVALRLFNEIQKHKRENREKMLRVEKYKTLEHTTVYLAVDTTARFVRALGNVEEITVRVDDRPVRFSPVYLAEQARDVSADSTRTVYRKRDGIFPRLNAAIESIVLLNLVVDLDFYKDQIHIMERGFISPLNRSALTYYNLYFNDSIISGEEKYYHFSFSPKNRHNPLFTGHFTIEDGSFALTEIEVYISKEANLNFINGFRAGVNYGKTPGGNWFYNEQAIRVNMSLTPNKEDSVSRYVSRRVDNVAKGNWLIGKTIQYTTSERLDGIRAAEWKDQPEFTAGVQEVEAYSRVNALKEKKVVKGIDAIGGTALTGYFNLGKIDLGPVFDIYNTNAIEGNRVSLALRTAEEMFPRFSVGGFLGMGTRSKELKYGMNMAWQPKENDRFILRASYSQDYRLVALDKYFRFVKYNPNNKGTSNLIAAFTTREQNPYLKEEQTVEFRLEYNAPSDLHLEASPYFTISKRTPEVRFLRGDAEYRQYRNYGVLFNMRNPFRQHYDRFFFDRVYYISRTPVVNFSCDVGRTLLPQTTESRKTPGFYSRFHGSIHGRLTMGQVFMNYLLNAGFLFGDAPYDLLDQPAGSMSMGYSKYNFNLLHHAAFAHNVYGNTHFYFNGGGILLNRVPLLRSLRLREIVSFKGHYGGLTDAYRGVFDLPAWYRNDRKAPYGEIGFGVTNIFKVLRVEYVMQFNPGYRNLDFTDNGGFFFRTEMSF